MAVTNALLFLSLMQRHPSSFIPRRALHLFVASRLSSFWTSRSDYNTMEETKEQKKEETSKNHSPPAILRKSAFMHFSPNINGVIVIE